MLSRLPCFLSTSHRFGARLALIIALSTLMMNGQNAFGANVCEAMFEAHHLSLSSSSMSQAEVNGALRSALAGEYENYQTWSKKAVILAMRQSLKGKIEKSCQAGQCAEADIARIVQTSIVNTFEKLDTMKSQVRRVRGYATLIGISVAIAVSNGMIKSDLPHSVQWISEFVTIGTSISLYKLGAPFWDYLGGIFYRGAFRIHDGKSFFRNETEVAAYGRHYRNLNEKMTSLQQQGAARIANLLGIAESTLAPALESLQSTDPSKGGMNRAAGRIANFAIKTRKFFPDISVDDPDLGRTVNMVFTNYLGDRPTRLKLYELTIQQIQNYDEAFAEDESTAAMYRHAIRLWAGLSADSLEDSAP